MSVDLQETKGVRLAIEGCGHGTLHAIYASVAEACKHKGWPGIDLLIIGGDFQSVRNAYDLNCVNMPAKYRSMCDFHEYYSAQRTAPYLTVFVGGNHEASNYLFELYYGGWVAPNIYYMGAANILRFGPLRIAALSGIWKGYNYRKPHFERLPYNESDMRSVYHVRELDVRKLLQVRTQVDIGISHDWPKGVEWKGNWKQLFRFKAHLEDDARGGQLGSVAAQQAMDWLRPLYWFSAHLHCKYAAVVEHEDKNTAQKALPEDSQETPTKKNQDEIDLDDEMDYAEVQSSSTVPVNENEINLEDEPLLESERGNPNGPLSANADEINLDDEEAPNGQPGLDHPSDGDVPEPSKGTSAPLLSAEDARAALPEAFRKPPAPEPVERPQGIVNKTTEFLALDKCLPGKHFLQLLEMPFQEDAEICRPLRLEYDREWLSIVRTFALDEPLTLGDDSADVPRTKPQAEYGTMINKRRQWVDENIEDAGLVVPENFEVVAPVYDQGNWNLPQYSQIMEHPNPQTARFCELLQIPNFFALSQEDAQRRLADGPRPDPEFDGGRGRGAFGGGRGRGGGRRGGRGRGRGGGGRGGRFRGR